MMKRWFSIAASGFLLWCCAGFAEGSLVLHYDFEETSGSSFVDKSGNGYDMNATSMDFTVAGKFGSGAYFNGNIGTGASATGATIAGLKALTSNQITISFWAGPDAESNGGVNNNIFSMGPGRFANSHLEYSNGIIYWDFNTAGASGYDRVQAAGGTVADGYHHFVYTYDGNNGVMRIYKDNAILASGTRTAGAIDWASITSFAIGGRYKGDMDDFALFDHVLSDYDRNVAFTQGIAAIVPEPATALGLIGLIAGAFFRRNRRKLS